MKSFFRSTLVLSIIILVLVALPVSTALAYTEGPNTSGSGSNVAGIGTEAWQNPGNITEPGTPYTTVSLYHNHLYSNYLQAAQYGFAIPAEATINGITLDINRQSSAHNPSIIDNVVSLVKSGNVVGDNKASTSAWPLSSVIFSYGGPTDLWGTTWTPNDINSPDFGAVLAIYRQNNGNNDRTGMVDSMQITVYYTFNTSTSVDCGNGNPMLVYGDSLTCVATVTRLAGSLTPTGTVTWSTDGSGSFDTNPCTLNGADGVATCSVTYTPTAIGTGTHLVTATYNGDDYFTSGDDSQTVTVTPRPVTVTADPQNKVYGDPDPALTYQITQGSLVFSDTFTGTLTRESGEDVGFYAIQQGSLALPVDYNLMYVGDYLNITKAEPFCDVTGYEVTYDGNLHTATGACTGVNGDELTGLDLGGTTHTDAGVYTDPWTFTDESGNYDDNSGMVEDNIFKADATCEVTPYDTTYDGNAHTATGACTGVMDEDLPGLDLSGTIHTEAGSYMDTWIFTNNNYNDQNGMVEDNITKADAMCEVTPYEVTYDGDSHTATGTCTGVDGSPVSGLDLSGTTHTDAGIYTDAWTFINNNYNAQGGTIEDSITKADAVCEITSYDLSYDGYAHTATGSCTGMDGNPLNGLDLTGTTHLSAGTYTNPWSYTDQTGNYYDQSGTIEDNIAKANATCEVTPYNVTFDGSSHITTGLCSGVNGEPLSGLNLNGTIHTVAGSYTDPWTFTDQTGNYNDASGTVEDNIAKAEATCEITGYTVEYDRAAHTADGACTGVLGEDLSGLDLSGTTHTQVNSYPDDPWTFTDVSGNYNDANGIVSNEITKRVITIAADTLAKKYGQPDPELTFQITFGSLLVGDTFSGELNRQAGESAGTYSILQGSLSLPEYYTMTFVGADFTITGGRYLIPIMLSLNNFH
jgi:MBG domain (YGX type)/Bacterial Ig-like domain (group 3)